jgi:hypothetical protein
MKITMYGDYTAYENWLKRHSSQTYSHLFLHIKLNSKLSIMLGIRTIVPEMYISNLMDLVFIGILLLKVRMLLEGRLGLDMEDMLGK